MIEHARAVVENALDRVSVRPSLRSIGLVCLLLMEACAPVIKKPPAESAQPPRLATAHFVTADGSVLPVRSWLPETQPARAVIVALHGFNDYSYAFELPASYFRTQGIASYAYDQRGFGRAPNRGYWAGASAYADDLRQFTATVRKRHPGIPIYILGESMGAAVAIVATTGDRPPAADGLILSAPAIWSRATMPWYQRLLLAGSAHTFPGLTLTGQGLKVVASDNVEILRGLGRDPWVIKGTRVDAIYGLVDLMDQAMARIPQLRMPTLVLVGEHDQIIPKEPLDLMIKRLPKPPARVATYAEGYHLLLRDLHAKQPWRDIVAWLADRSEPLPSGADKLLARSAVATVSGVD